MLNIFFFIGNATTGDQQLVVSMEFNGTMYEGVLFAHQTTNSPTNTSAAAPTAAKLNNSMDERTNRVSRPLISS